MYDSDYKKHNFSFWKWVAWAVITLPLSAYVLKSTYDLWPHLIWMAMFSAVSVVGASLYAAVYTTENAHTLRNVALTALGVIELALFINAAMHGGGARAYENASAGREERQIDENRQVAIDRQKAETAAKVSDARTKQLDSLAQLAKNEAAKIDSANRYARRTGIRTYVNPAPVSAPQPEATKEILVSEPKETIQTDRDIRAKLKNEVIETPSEAREKWFWGIFVGLLLELGAGIGGAYKITRVRLADANKNNVADWKEELSPQELRERIPRDYETLYGGSAKKETRH